MGDDAPQAEHDAVRVTVSGGDGAIMEAARRLDRAGVGVQDIAVRRPTLDDVFMSVTGHAAATEEERQEVAA
jgi:ABC-2 type transport system ATP-binding protein